MVLVGLSFGFSLASIYHRVLLAYSVSFSGANEKKNLFPTLLVKQGPKMNSLPWLVGEQTCTAAMEINMVVVQKIGN